MKTRIIKDLIKRVVDYRIEGDYHVYTVKNTPLTIRILMTKKYNRKKKLFLTKYRRESIVTSGFYDVYWNL